MPDDEISYAAYLNETPERITPEPFVATIDFDEAWYLRTNADVAAAVAAGRCPSGYYHYLMHGRDEGRRPSRWASDTPLVEIADPPPLEVPPGEATPAALEPPLAELAPRHAGAQYLCPTDLGVTELPLRRLLAIGSCFLKEVFLRHAGSATGAVEFFLTNNLGQLPAAPAHAPDQYDFQVVQVALRSVMPDAALWHLPYADLAAHGAVFDTVRDRLAMQLDLLLAWNKAFGIPALVMNFLVPQANPLGRLLPRYDLRNPAYFIEQLNVALEQMLAGYRDAYILDVDRVAASLGRRYVQDDSVAVLSHNSLLEMPGFLGGRIEPLAPMVDHYDIRWAPAFIEAVWAEAAAMHRTLRRQDAVKLVVVDLDDTLWNGVSGEMEAVGPEMLEGWPIGLAETLATLKRRGILLAILSKNDDSRVAARWESIFRNRLRLEDFATRRIDWNAKADNMREILAELSLLPRSVVFIDDNPVERAAMLDAFPEMRVLGRHPYYLRRVLLWSAETQVPVITAESARRTPMVRAQIEREGLRRTSSREEFLASLATSMRLFEVTADHPHFARALELLNKTNQFNTTAKTWTPAALAGALAGGKTLLAFEVSDRLTSYGLVGAMLAGGAVVEQFVMSCRVLGLDVEIAAMAVLVERLRARGHGPIAAVVVNTDSNLASRDLFSRCGFVAHGPNAWFLAGDAPPVPGHIAVQVA